MTPISNPMSTLHMALLSITLIAAHIGLMFIRPKGRISMIGLPKGVCIYIIR